MKVAVLLACCLASGIAGAEPTTAVIPGKAWSLSFDIGLVAAYQAKRGPDSFQYMATTAPVGGAPATTLSFFLEREAATSKEDCRNAFWTRSLSNPMIAGDSVKTTSLPGYEQVLYRLTNGQPHANFYFVQDGYCVDVHVSLTRALPMADELLAGYGKTLRWK